MLSRTLIAATLATLGFLATILIIYPGTYSHVRSAIPVGLHRETIVQPAFFGGDDIQVLYEGWRMRDSVSEFRSPVVDENTFVSNEGTHYSFNIGVQFWMIGMISFVLGLASAYNFVVFAAGPFLIAASSFLLFYSLRPRFWLATFAAFSIVLLPYRVLQTLGGHSGGLVLFFVPLYIYLILRERMWAPARTETSWLAGLVLLLTIVSDEHQGYYLVLLSGFVFPIWFMQDLWSRRTFVPVFIETVSRWRGLLFGLAMSVVYAKTLDAVWSSARVEHAPRELKRSIFEISHYSKPLSDFLKIGQNDVASIIVFVIVFGGIAVALRHRRQWRAALASPLLPMGVAAFFLTFLMLGIGAHWTQRTGIYELAYKVVPYFSYQRVPVKLFSVVALLAFGASILVIDSLFSPKRRWRDLVSGAIMAAQCGGFILGLGRAGGGIIFENIYAYDELARALRAECKPDTKIMLYPTSTGDRRIDNFNQLLAMRSDCHFTAGYSGQPPAHFAKWNYLMLNADHWSHEDLSRLEKIGVTHVLIDREQTGEYGMKLFTALERAGMSEPARIPADDRFLLVRLQIDPVAARTLLPELGWGGRDTIDAAPVRWMRGIPDPMPDFVPKMARDRFDAIAIVDAAASVRLIRPMGNGGEIRIAAHPAPPAHEFVVFYPDGTTERFTIDTLKRDGPWRVVPLKNVKPPFAIAAEHGFLPMPPELKDEPELGFAVAEETEKVTPR